MNYVGVGLRDGDSIALASLAGIAYKSRTSTVSQLVERDTNGGRKTSRPVTGKESIKTGSLQQLQ